MKVGLQEVACDKDGSSSSDSDSSCSSNDKGEHDENEAGEKLNAGLYLESNFSQRIHDMVLLPNQTFIFQLSKKSI